MVQLGKVTYKNQPYITEFSEIFFIIQTNQKDFKALNSKQPSWPFHVPLTPFHDTCHAVNWVCTLRSMFFNNMKGLEHVNVICLFFPKVLKMIELLCNKTGKLVAPKNDVKANGKCPLCLHLWSYLFVCFTTCSSTYGINSLETTAPGRSVMF